MRGLEFLRGFFSKMLKNELRLHDIKDISAGAELT